MNRREALTRVGLLLGGTIIGAEAFLSGCNNAPEKTVASTGANFTNDDIAFFDEIAEKILPKTDTPGAKDAKVGEFMARIVKDCYPEKDQQIFIDGMTKLNDASQKKNGTSFMKSTAEQKHDLLVELDKEQKAYMDKKQKDEPAHYFRMMKELTLWGYFTSEEGATKALRYVAVPGKYQGCIDYKKGDKAWATA
ncbi:MAG: gluconate 2-dehydrogenase subunit 3 family protein [Bacteroidetes bacterium]|nr:gluconate 2-dehydrogenase subunit 3 family protein [Bacteroidota bacterium]